MSTILNAIISLLAALNKTSTYRLIMYSVLGFIFISGYYYRNELKYVLSSAPRQVTLVNVAETQELCYDLRNKYNAEAVMVYAYQPDSDEKTHKERLALSAGDRYSPLESTKMLNLFAYSDVIHTIIDAKYYVITENTKSKYADIVIGKKLNQIIITGIFSSTDELIGEVVWVFINEPKEPPYAMYKDSQVFRWNFSNQQH